MTERIQRSTPATLTFSFYTDGALHDTDTSTATITITKADGTALVTNVNAPRVSTGIYKYDLAPQATLNRLVAACSGVFSGSTAVNTMEVEIVGDFLFTVEGIRAWDTALASNTTYPDDRIKTVRNQVETEFEDHCGYGPGRGRGFVARYEREILSGDGTNELILRHPEPLTILKLTVDGVDVTSTAVCSADADEKRLLKRSDAVWPATAADNIVIEYEYGRIIPPDRIVEAAMKRARGRLVSKNARIDERANVMSIPDFGTFNLATPGMRGSVTGIPEVDIVLYDYELTAGVY